MNASSQAPKKFSPFQAATIILLFLTVGVWGAAASAVGLLELARQVGGAIGAFLNEAGPDRVMRRCLMGWAGVFILILLWRAGWRGWRDCGYAADDPAAPARPWWGHVLLGIGLGLISMGCLSLMTLFLDLRIVTPVATAAEGWRRGLSFIWSGISVALIEETVCRGMLFRVLARAWSVWLAALFTSLLFALAHFLSPDPQSFQGTSFLRTSLNVMASTYAQAVRTPDAGLVFINLSLLGIVFCGFVVRTRNLWLAIGTHAAWVWVVKFFHLWTEVAPKVPASRWLGVRSDFMDSLAVTSLLILLVAWGFTGRRRLGDTLIHQDDCWQVAPGEARALANWLNRYTVGGLLKEGVLLKDHDGSVVKAKAGLVIKSYWPKNNWAGIHFAIRPSRARRAFRLGQEMLALGIPTPRPIAWKTTRRFGFLRNEAFIMAEAQAAETLTDWLKRDIRDSALRARVMAAYGRLLAMFHRAGYSNRDMKHSNIMNGAREPWQLQVVDLDGVRRLRWISRGRAGRDLMRVGQSLASLGWTGEADVRAFFEAYNDGVPPRLRRLAFPP